jgi:hypothetical protein
MDTCVTRQQLNSDFDKISELFIRHYDKNIETQLNTHDQQLLDEVSDKLNEIANAQNINFNKDGFKTFIKKIYVYNLTQFGGDSDDEEDDEEDDDEKTDDEKTPYSRQNYYLPNRYDFFAIIIFFASIFLLYISFVKFNELSQSITGMSIDELGQDTKLQVQDALSKIGKLPTEQLTFLQYVWSSIQTFSCSIVETQSQRLRNIVTESLSHSLQDFTAIATRTCMPRTQVVTEGIYSISSSYTGDIDFGKTLNSLVQGASGLTSASTTSACISNTALLLQKKAIDELYHQRSLMINQLTAQSTQAISFLSYGTYIGTTSVMYLLYRTKDILGIAYAQFTPTRRVKNSRDVGQLKITERGGNKKKYTRKHKKTSRKHKKTSRKHKKTSRKHKKISRKHRNKSRKYLKRY